LALVLPASRAVSFDCAAKPPKSNETPGYFRFFLVCLGLLPQALFELDQALFQFVAHNVADE
jgi:hypothetical protein